MKNFTQKFTGILALVFTMSFTVNAQTAITQANIQSAVDLWVSNEATSESTYGHISDWDVSNVTSMSSLFQNKPTFNGDISSWDVSNVNNWYNMFAGNTNLSDANKCAIHNSFSSNEYWSSDWSSYCDE